MNILLVNHTFPPESYAGSELCVLSLAAELTRRGHAVAVFYRIDDADQDEYALEETEYQGIPVCRINHTYRYAQRFEDIYEDPMLGARFAAYLRKRGVEVVHFHHLTNLSLSLVHEAKMAGCRVVFTLHDYWLLCQRGQLLRPDLSLCDGPGPMKCRSCLALQLLRGRAQRWLGGALRRLSPNQRDAGLDLLHLRGAGRQTPEEAFIQVTHFDYGDAPGETLMMHPPAEVVYPHAIKAPMRFEAQVAMAPSTYDQSGGGVRFEVWLGDTLYWSRELDPKQREEDRGWHPVSVALDGDSPEAARLTLRTRALAERNDFCAAGWRQPRLNTLEPASAQAAPSKRQKTLRNWAQNLARHLVHLFPEAREGIAHRRNRVAEIFEETDLFIAPSKFLHDFFIRYGMPPDKILHSDYGFVPQPRLPRRRAALPLRFGYLGTWIPSKGVDLAIEAFQNVDPAQAQLTVYGFFPGYDGYEDYEDYLRSIAGPAVTFAGRYLTEDLPQIYQNLDALLVPSIWWENSPLTIHEAFQLGVPVITADRGGMAELVAAGGGMTFRHRDAQSLQQVIEQLIADPAAIDRMRETIPDVKLISERADEMLRYYQATERPA